MDLVDLLHVHRGRLLLVDAEPQVRRDRDAVLAAHRCEEEDGDGMAGLDGERAGPSLRRVSEIWAGDRRPRLGRGRRRRRRRRRRRARSRAGGDGRRARRRRTDDGGAVVTHDAHCASGRGGNGEDQRRGDDERRATARGTFERDGATDGRTDDGRRSAEDERAGRRGGTHSRAGSKRVGDGARVDREDAAARRARGYDRVATVRCVLRCDRAMDGDDSRCEPAVALHSS